MFQGDLWVVTTWFCPPAGRSWGHPYTSIISRIPHGCFFPIIYIYILSPDYIPIISPYSHHVSSWSPVKALGISISETGSLIDGRWLCWKQSRRSEASRWRFMMMPCPVCQMSHSALGQCALFGSELGGFLHSNIGIFSLGKWWWTVSNFQRNLEVS